MMEAHNVTRILISPPTPILSSEQDITSKMIQFTNYSTNILSETGQRHNNNNYNNDLDWMEAVYTLQQKWNVWNQYTFLNPDSLTAQQKQAIACEAINEQDCTSRNDMCLPSHC